MSLFVLHLHNVAAHLALCKIIVICKSDIMKHILSAPVLKGWLRKWMFTLSEFDIPKGSQGTSIGIPDRKKNQY
jgi:hypothetical protein